MDRFRTGNEEREKFYYEHIDRIADRLGVSIDYLVRGNEIKSDSLSSCEKELVECYRRLSDDAKDVLIQNARLLA